MDTRCYDESRLDPPGHLEVIQPTTSMKEYASLV